MQLKNNLIFTEPIRKHRQKIILTAIILITTLIPAPLLAGNDRPELAADLIPAELKRNANAVMRYAETEYTIESQNAYTFSQTEAITILGKGGEDYSRVTGFYDKWHTLLKMEISIYDAQGKLLRKVKQKDILDRSYISSGILYDDSRIKTYKPLLNTYPYTIVYTIVTRITNFGTIRPWYPWMSMDMSVESSEFKLTHPEDYRIGIKSFNLDEPEISDEDRSVSYRWKVEQIPATLYESYLPPDIEISPMILLKPEVFKVDGRNGSNENWEEMGRFYYNLNNGLDEISPQGTAEIYHLIKDAKNDREKVEILFGYMQKKTRYVAVELGIGGIQPFPASYVEKYGYGDCKSLSNYMKGLLAAAGIKSYYTLVGAGEHRDPVLTDFSADQFNHIIVCVPLENDTVWLECTNQIIPCGFLGSFTDNRHVLLITEDGGKMVRTPVYSASDNFRNTCAEVIFDQQFNARCKTRITYGDLRYEDLAGLPHVEQDRQKKILYNLIDIKEFTLNDYTFNEIPDTHPQMILDLQMDVNRYTSKTGNKIFLPLNLMNRIENLPSKTEERKYDVYLRMAYRDTDTIRYQIPDNYQVTFLPGAVEILSAFGSYHARCELEGNSLIYIREMERTNGTFPKEQYGELYDFYKDISRADNAKAMLEWRDPDPGE